ncbi:MAG: DUF3822 family protein [Bacteroidales bacterium]|nr:DUF3822 family protein [Bacteroidales bacterium]
MSHKLDINIEPAQTTLVPKKIFNPERSQAFVELNFEFDSTSQVVLSETCNDIVFLSVVDQKIYDVAMSMFPTGKFFSTYHLLYQAFEKSTRLDKRSKHQVFLNLTANSFDLFVFEKKQRLIFANTFTYQSANDLLYYLLNVVNRLKIDTGGLTLKMIDSTRDSENLMSILESYFLSVNKFSDDENPLSWRVGIQPGLWLINPALCE